jgi:hypothetical protein
MSKIINMTPHPIMIVGADGQIMRTIAPSGSLIRLKASTVTVGQIDEIPVSETVFGEPEGLPELAEDTYYIVSAIVKTALPNRSDLLVTAEAVRDGNGNITGCRSLGK